MAGLAQGLQVGFIVGAAVIKRQDVVDFLSWRHPSVCFALFAERVGCDVAVPDLAPGMAVTLVDLWVALVAAVGSLMLCRVLLAVAVGGELGAAGVGARRGWFAWHLVAPF